MIPINFGRDLETGNLVYFDRKNLARHLWGFGATGSGKTTVLQTLLRQLLIEPQEKQKHCLILIDVMGGLSEALLNWIAHPQFCTDDVRQRLVYYAPSDRNRLIPFNPMVHSNVDDLYWATGRTVEVMLRAWSSQDLDAMPRLRQWMFNALFSVAHMGFPIAAAEFLLRPGTDQHKHLLNQIPPRLRMIWAEVLSSGGNARMQLLESTRNRTAPFFDCKIVQMMLSQNENRFDVARFIRERKIVIIDLSEQEVLDPHIANTLAGMYVNEVVRTVKSLPPKVVSPTMLCLDEFAQFISQDMYYAIGALRQRGCQLALLHQSLAQLKRGDLDLSDIIFQCRNRILLMNDGRDADEIAHELASFEFDPMKLKEEIKVYRQKKTGQHREWLRSFSNTNTSSQATDRNWSSNEGENSSETAPKSGEGGNTSRGKSSGNARGGSEKEAVSSGHTEGMHETFVDDYEEFYETSSKQYYTFDEQLREWARDVRKLKTGEAICKFHDDPKLHKIKGHILEIPVTPMLEDLKAELLDKNYQQDFFVDRQDAENKWDDIVEKIGVGKNPFIGTDEKICLEGNSEKTPDRDEGESQSVFR